MIVRLIKAKIANMKIGDVIFSEPVSIHNRITIKGYMKGIVVAIAVGMLWKDKKRRVPVRPKEIKAFMIIFGNNC